VSEILDRGRLPNSSLLRILGRRITHLGRDISQRFLTAQLQMDENPIGEDIQQPGCTYGVVEEQKLFHVTVGGNLSGLQGRVKGFDQVKIIGNFNGVYAVGVAVTITLLVCVLMGIGVGVGMRPKTVSRERSSPG
jgi:hypothetical protein